MPVALQAVLATLAITAATYDWRFRRIPNWLSLSGLVLALGLRTFLSGWSGCETALLGLGTALLIYVPLHLLRGMGAGDVKLMATVGAIAGPADWIAIFLVTALAGGLVSLCVVLYKRRLIHTLLNLSFLTSELLRGHRPAESLPALDVKNTAALRLPHAIPIAVGCLLFLVLRPA